MGVFSALFYIANNCKRPVTCDNFSVVVIIIIIIIIINVTNSKADDGRRVKYVA